MQKMMVDKVSSVTENYRHLPTAVVKDHLSSDFTEALIF